jgi:hypothetical protein
MNLGAELRRSSAFLLAGDSQSEVPFSGLYVKRIGKEDMSRDESGAVVCGRLRENMGGEWQPGGIARGIYQSNRGCGLPRQTK